MKLKDYLKKNKITVTSFSEYIGVSRYSIHKYIKGETPRIRWAWAIYRATDGHVSFQEMGYDIPPKDPLKDK